MKHLLLAAIVVAMLVLSGCGGVPLDSDGEGVSGEALSSKKQRVDSPGVPESDLARLVEGNSAFAFELYRSLVEERESDNLFYSPYSISLALAMTYAGARGLTEEQMAETLHYLLPQEALHPAFNTLDQELAQRGEGAEGKDDEGFRLNIANAIWGQKDYTFRDAFLDTLAENYGAGLRVLDFASAPEESRQIINQWVSEKTEGKIEDLLPKGVIDSMTRMVLTNAIYFNAAWAHPFEEDATQEGPFTLLDGGDVTVPLMRQTESFGYTSGEDYQAVELPYDGHDLSMVVVLPAADAFESFEQSLSVDQIASIIEDLDYQQVTLTMPRFEYESSFSLKETLEALGMRAAFSGEADFSGMTGDRSLFISEILHKAFVSVDEEGTEAAAATAVVMTESAAPGQPVEVTIDHPFIFLIRDIETGTILFVGRVVDPSV